MIVTSKPPEPRWDALGASLEILDALNHGNAIRLAIGQRPETIDPAWVANPWMELYPIGRSYVRFTYQDLEIIKFHQLFPRRNLLVGIDHRSTHNRKEALTLSFGSDDCLNLRIEPRLIQRISTTPPRYGLRRWTDITPRGAYHDRG